MSTRNISPVRKYGMQSVILLITILTLCSLISGVLAQESVSFSADKSDYAPDETGILTGSGFAAGPYKLAVMDPDSAVTAVDVTADEAGAFTAEFGPLTLVGDYIARLYPAEWVDDWSAEPLASAEFSASETPPAEPLPTEPPPVEPLPTEPPPVEPLPTEPPPVEPPAEPPPAPTIAADKLDYLLGELVTLTGQNWQGDTQVRIFVNDTIWESWWRDVIVDVQPDGSISDSFNLPGWFVASYTVTATGRQTGREATTWFTDANVGTYQQRQGL